MTPSDPKPPADAAPKPATPRADNGVRWLSRPERALPAAGAPPPSPAAGSPQAPTAPRAFDPASAEAKALTVPLGAGRGGTYALIAGIALLASSAVVAALLFAARAPGNAASAARALSEIATASASASATPSAIPIPTATATPSFPIPAETATATATPTATPPTPSAAPPTAASDEGTISTPPNGAGHRIFVDGRYAGDSPGPIKVRCGHHAVKVGSGGASRSVDVPCGGDVLVSPR